MYPIHPVFDHQLEPFRALTGPAVLYAQVRCHPRVFQLQAHPPLYGASLPLFTVPQPWGRMSYDFDLQEQ